MERFLNTGNALDKDKERERLQKELAGVEKEIEKAQTKSCQRGEG